MTGFDSTTSVEISEAARRTAEMAAREAGMPLANWLALAILGAAADQAGLGTSGENPPHSSSDIHATLDRLEAKLDQALASHSDSGMGQHFG